MMGPSRGAGGAARGRFCGRRVERQYWGARSAMLTYRSAGAGLPRGAAKREKSLILHRLLPPPSARPPLQAVMVGGRPTTWALPIASRRVGESARSKTKTK